MRRILIFDTTLRDGLKSPGTILSIEEKVRIAKQIARLQADVIEAGFPAASEEEFATVERIANEIPEASLCVLARATNPRDFEIAKAALKNIARRRIHTFVPASKKYRQHFLKKSAEETLEIGVSAIRMARKYADDVEFSLVDAFRADPDEVVRLVNGAIEAGAATVNLADTVGCATPSDVSRLFHILKEKASRLNEIVLGVHCHNDLGLATANSLAAVAEGAMQVHCTVNGIGERAGNAALEEVAALLNLRAKELNASTNIRLDQIYPACRLVRRITGIGLQPHKPIVGTNAFFFESVAPQLADSTEKPPFEILNRETLGIDNGTDHLSGETTREQFSSRLVELGYKLIEEKIDECYEAFQELAARKEQVFDADLELLVGTRAAVEQFTYKLVYLNVTAGSISVPTATVQLEIDGETFHDAGFGHGPVDATFKTICKMAKRCPKLLRYELNAVTPGTDAQGEVTVRLEENGQIVNGRAVDTDIVMASAKAFVDGLNKLESLHVEPSISEFTDDESWMPRL